MTFLGDLHDGIDRLAVFAELDVELPALTAGVAALSDTSVRDAFDTVATLGRNVKKLETLLAGVIAQRSTRAAGRGGLAQTGGFRTPVQMVQEITGVSKGEAGRVVRVGTSLIEADAGVPTDPDDKISSADSLDVPAPPAPWHTPLSDALLAGAITHAQHDAIRRGLGEPPAIEGRADDEVAVVWRLAAERLIEEAATSTVEELIADARAARDLMDPVGAQERWAEHFAQRSFRMRVDDDGRRRGYIDFDDEGAAFWQAVFDAALRPRRGGPRFVAADEVDAARELLDDPRTNDQLAYDLMMDLFRAGSLAEAKDVFGARRAGVRLVTMLPKHDGAGAGVPRDLFGRLLTVAEAEDARVALPGSVLDAAICDSGTVEVKVDSCGNPLDVGREKRLFTPAQRSAFAVRDGGCMWPGCDRPPAYCEAHHIDEWVADNGRTDTERGLLLCRYHHMLLHNLGWTITRHGTGPFILHPPPGDDRPPIELRSKSPLRWLFDPPPRRDWRHAA